jgi:hypothetical protein
VAFAPEKSAIEVSSLAFETSKEDAETRAGGVAERFCNVHAVYIASVATLESSSTSLPGSCKRGEPLYDLGAWWRYLTAGRIALMGSFIVADFGSTARIDRAALGQHKCTHLRSPRQPWRMPESQHVGEVKEGLRHERSR